MTLSASVLPSDCFRSFSSASGSTARMVDTNVTMLQAAIKHADKYHARDMMNSSFSFEGDSPPTIPGSRSDYHEDYRKQAGCYRGGGRLESGVNRFDSRDLLKNCEVENLNRIPHSK